MLSLRFLYPAILLVWLIAGCQPANTYVEPPPPEVTVAPPLQKAVTTYVHYTGTTHAVAKVDVRARVKGFLKKRFFEEGSIVKEGQLLLVIDEEPFTVQLDQARARLAEAEASLKKAEESRTREVARAQLSLDRAQLVLSRIDEMRSQNLFSRKAASREDLEKAEATRKKNAAQVEADLANLKQLEADYEINILSARAGIKAAMTAVRTAEIDLGYCRVTAPIEGRITRAEVDAGNYVGDGQATLLASIHKLNPIYAYMYVSEDDMLRARKAIAAEAAGDKPRTPIKLEMGLANEEGYPHQGRADYTDPGVRPRDRHHSNAGRIRKPGRRDLARASSSGFGRRSKRAPTPFWCPAGRSGSIRRVNTCWSWVRTMWWSAAMYAPGIRSTNGAWSKATSGPTTWSSSRAFSAHGWALRSFPRGTNQRPWPWLARVKSRQSAISPPGIPPTSRRRTDIPRA